MLSTVAVAGYRSLRQLVLELDQLTVVTGPNGSGKSNLYRSLRLLAACGQGQVIGALAQEGGLASSLWAGPRGSGRVALQLGFAADDVGYQLDLGLPQDEGSPFQRDPEIKTEAVWAGPLLRPGTLQAERRGPHLRTRDDSGRWEDRASRLAPYESMIDELVDPVATPELHAVRRLLRGWRFYDHFRTDPGAPAREVRPGTRTPVLAPTGDDLAAALTTIEAMGDPEPLERAVADAFDGARLRLSAVDGRFGLALEQPGLQRPLAAAELSDGTLRYLMVVAALLSPRPPSLLVLNEPEANLHPSMLTPLARLVRAAAQTTQLVVVTHAEALAEALLDAGADGGGTVAGRAAAPVPTTHVELTKDLGETVVVGREGRLDQPAWSWTSR